MSTRFVRYLFLMLVLAFGGCATGITVTHVAEGDKPLRGNPWNLPMTQFNITITRSVVGCDAMLKGAVEVIATSGVALDEDQRYILESNGWWATSDITSNLAPSGVSTGLNAQSTDATATIISNVVSTVGQVLVAGAALAGAPPVPNGSPPPAAKACNDEIKNAVQDLYPAKGTNKPTLKQQVDDDTAALAELTARVTLLTGLVQADGSYKKDLRDALRDQASAQARLKNNQEKLAAHLKKTSYTQVVQWPLRSSELRRDEPFKIDPEVLDKWTDDDKIRQDAPTQFDVYLALYRRDAKLGSWEPPPAPASGRTSVGVPVRLARIGRLLACRQVKCPPSLRPDATVPTEHTDANREVLLNAGQVVLQLGQVYEVPLTGGTFKAEKAAIALDTNGLPTSIQVVEQVAAGVTATGALKDTATQIAALPAQISAAQLARIQAQTNQLNAEAALAAAQANAGVAGQTGQLAAQKALIDAQVALATARANAGIGAQTTGLTAQAALLNAQAALATAQANAGVAPEVSTLGAQTSLLNAQAAQINAASALAKARAGGI